MDKDKEKRSFFDMWHEGYKITNYVIGPAIFLIILILFAPSLYKAFFVDSEYCVGKKEDYKRLLDKYVNYKPITSISEKNHGFLFIGKIKEENTLFLIDVCSNQSKGDNSLKVTDIKVGDTIYKETGSNEFTLIKKGKKYIFKIDPSRDKNGKLIE